jgi:two-component system sensor histidine kinase ArlS
MKIRTRLTLIYLFNTIIILLTFSFFVYNSEKKNREKEFFMLLEKEAYSRARIFFNKQIIPEIQQQFYHNNRKFIPDAKVAVYDSNCQLVYNDLVKSNVLKEHSLMLKDFNEGIENYSTTDGKQVVGVRYDVGNKSYIVMAIAYDEYGLNKLNYLKENIIEYFLISVVFIFVVGYYFSDNAFAPLREIIKDVKNISASNLYSRLKTKKSKDELFELAETFNKMLDRLEDSFMAQKHFVANTSHELRTPLTRLSGELEIALQKKRKKKEYVEVLRVLFNDTQKLIRLTNSLLNLAKVSGDNSELFFETVRVDEILLDVQYLVQQKNSAYQVYISFEKEMENESGVSIFGSEELLQIAFLNIVENSCKFSPDHKAQVIISKTSEGVVLYFSDNGIGIAQEDLEAVFTPFYRGNNRHFAEGSGIGLALTHKIISLHGGSIKVTSELDMGTTFTIMIPNI